MSKHNFEIKKVEKLPNAEAEITGEITLPFLTEKRKEAIANLSKNLKVPGFRSGHIPEDVLLKNIGEMKVLEETAEIALGGEYPQIIEESKLAVIGRPFISITKLAPGVPLEFKVRVHLEPEFDLPDYKKIALDVKPARPDESGHSGGEEAGEKRRLKIIEELVKQTEIVIPNVLIEAELTRMLTQFKGEVTHAGVKWEEYLKQVEKTEADVKAEWKESAEKRVKAELIVIKIAEKEKIEPEKTEVETGSAHLLEHHPEVDPLQARIYIYTQLRNQKVLSFLEGLK